MSLTQDTKDAIHNGIAKYLFNAIGGVLDNNPEIIEEGKKKKVAFELSQLVAKNVSFYLVQGEKYLTNQRNNASVPDTAEAATKNQMLDPFTEE